jgi:general stress protein 26
MITATDVRADGRLREMLADFHSAMLVTRTAAGELRSRPMAVAQVEPNGQMWFMTDRYSGKLEEIANDDHVNISMQSKSTFVSVSGRAVVIEDGRKVDELWNEAWKVYFPGGKDDPSLVLLKVHGETGEYWDYSGTSGIRYFIEAGKAYLSGTKPDVAEDPKVHGKVVM